MIFICIFRKDHVRQENVAARKWPENWDFLTTKYEDVRKVCLVFFVFFFVFFFWGGEADPKVLQPRFHSFSSSLPFMIYFIMTCLASQCDLSSYWSFDQPTGVIHDMQWFLVPVGLIPVGLIPALPPSCYP